MLKIPQKRTVCILLFLLTWVLLFFLSSPISAKEERPALFKAADKDGCRLTLLKNKNYFHTLEEKIRTAGAQIVMAFFLFKTSGHPESYPEILLKELINAARRGVRVTVVLEYDDKSKASVTRDNRAAYERLKMAGVDVYYDSPKKTMHTKLAVIDGRYTFIGSHNLTQSALKYNNELSMLVESTTIAAETLKYIEGLY